MLAKYHINPNDFMFFYLEGSSDKRNYTAYLRNKYDLYTVLAKIFIGKVKYL